jgi:hypothetical protein
MQQTQSHRFLLFLDMESRLFSSAAGALQKIEAAIVHSGRRSERRAAEGVPASPRKHCRFSRRSSADSDVWAARRRRRGDLNSQRSLLHAIPRFSY